MKTCWTVDINGYPIKLEQAGKNKFSVSYGADVRKGDYECAAKDLGAAIMHALACEGRLDNSEA